RVSGTEVPALTGFRPEWTAYIEQGTDFCHHIGDFVVTKQGRSTVGLTQAQVDIHGVATDVVIHVPPVGIADIVEAIRAAAVAGNGEPDSFRIIGRWEGEFTARQWNKRLDLGS